MSNVAVFVNTEDSPSKIVRQGVFKYIKRGDETFFFELCEVFYPHPEAPENATVQIYRWLEVSIKPGTEETIKYVVDAMKGISKVTEIS
jgi:hypothetical protein